MNKISLKIQKQIKHFGMYISDKCEYATFDNSEIGLF